MSEEQADLTQVFNLDVIFKLTGNKIHTTFLSSSL